MNYGAHRHWPRLLYIGDVPIENSYHGSALLHRLLSQLPPERLYVLESGTLPSREERRLPHVHYSSRLQPGRKWLTTRFHRCAGSLLSLIAPWRSVGDQERLADFGPQAVLTVAHGYSWMTAMAFARRRGLPLHLIVHDDWPRMVRVAGPIRHWVEKKFAECYQRAHSRLCVSPYMVEDYHERYGVPGDLLYPTRSPSCKTYECPPSRAGTSSRELVYAFGGTINTGGHAAGLRALATALAPQGAQLHIFGPLSRASAQAAGLVQPHVHLRGMIPADQFVHSLREEADVVYVPMSFAARDRGNSSLSFPSKLTDYTAAALPLLIHAPPYSSAVRWARSHPGVAEVVDGEGPENLGQAVSRLNDPAHRKALAIEAARVGSDCFSACRGMEVFHAALTRK